MNPPAPARLFLLLFTAGSVLAQAPSSRSAPATALPATPPTTTEPSAPAQAPPNHAQISYQNSQLTVAADNSSLNQILHDISLATGMTITGGVKEERVFGKYGPAPTSEVIGQLLDGTESNVLFLGANGSKPAELILTPRNGAATPPNPNARHYDEASAEPATPPPPPETESVPPPARPPESKAPGDSQPSSGGAKTPQQIYEELMKLRQQQK